MSKMATDGLSYLRLAAIVIGGSVGLLFLLKQYSLRTRDPREPPFIPETIPLIGHLISQISEGGSFFKRI